MSTLDLGARRSEFHRYATTPVRSRWDYNAFDRDLKDVVNDRYFRNFTEDLNPGDRIQIVDRNEEECEVRVQYVDDEHMKVGLAIVTEFQFKPAEGGYQIRHAGGRGRATRWEIVDPEGKVVEPDIAGKRAAERKLEDLIAA